MIKSYLVALLLLLLFSFTGLAQLSIEGNAWLNAEISKGQKNAHFYYNQIHANHKNWRVGISDLNVASKIRYHSSLLLNVRVRLNRSLGAKLDNFQLPQLNLQYAPSEENWSIMIGRFITPFGAFADLQHPKDRIFIGEPLRHSYYNNISPQVGFTENMGEDKFKIDGNVVWGNSMLYYGAYTNGLRFNWEIIPDKLTYFAALSNAAPNLLSNPFDFTNWGIINRLESQPTYFWEQGFSISYGSFSEVDDDNYDFAPSLNQFLVGTDFVLGYGFWSFNGEVLHARYRVPQYFPDEQSIEDLEQTLSSTSFSLSAKYEFPFVSGLYTALGFDAVTFSKQALYANRWDNQVWRLQLGAGYKISDFLLVRMGYNIQEVKNHPGWEQNTFRSILTIYY